MSTQSKGSSAATAGPTIDGFILAFAFLLTAVSGYTTWAGMARIFSSGSGADALLGPLAAAAFTACVQCALTAFGWLAGKDMARRLGGGGARSGLPSRIRQVVVLAIFVASVAVSAFFSYNTYFNHLYDGAEAVRRRATTVPAFLGAVQTGIDAALRRSEVERLAAAEGGAWATRLAAVADAAEKAGPALAKAGAERLRQAAEARRSAEAGAANARRRIATLDGGLVERRSNLAELDERIRQLDAAIEEAVAEQRREATGIGERKPGQGPKWQAAKEAETRLRATRATAVKLRDDLTAGLTAAERDLDGQKQRLAEAEGSLAAQAPGQSAPGAVATAAALVEPGAAVPMLRTVLDGFRRAPSQEGYDQAVALCQTLETILPETTDDGDCRDPSAAVAARTGEARREAMRRYESECTSVPEGLTGDFSGALRFAERCAATARQAGAATADVDAAIADFSEGNGDGRNEFANALDSVSKAPDLAGLSAFLAVFQDVLVFLLAFAADLVRLERRAEDAPRRDFTPLDVAPRPDDGEPLRALKAILAGVVPAPRRGGGFVYRVPAASPETFGETTIANIRHHLRGLVRDRLARPEAQGDGYLITDAGLMAVEDRVARLVDAASAASVGPRSADRSAVPIERPRPVSVFPARRGQEDRPRRDAGAS